MQGPAQKNAHFGPGVLAASLPPQTRETENLLIPFLSPISIV